MDLEKNRFTLDSAGHELRGWDFHDIRIIQKIEILILQYNRIMITNLINDRTS